MNGACNGNFFLPRPLGPWGGVKRSNIIKFQLQSQFQRFLFQTLCAFSKMKDTNISDGIFILSHGLCPRGGTSGHWGAQGVKKNIFKHGHVAHQIDGDHEQNRMQVKFSS